MQRLSVRLRCAGGCKNILILVVLTYFFFCFGNGIISLSNPDEVFYAGTAKEMINQHSWMTPYLFGQPQFEKPVFLYWMLRIAFMIFGIGSFAGRFFPAVFASLGVVAVYLFSLIAFKDEKKAFFTGLVLMSSGLYIGLARTIFTDMIFSVFILLSLLAFFWGYARAPEPKRHLALSDGQVSRLLREWFGVRLLHKEKKAGGIILFFVFSALAVLTKGPLGFFIPFMAIVIFLALKKELKFIFSKATLWGLLAFILIAFPWYLLMIKKYGSSFTHEFFYNDHIRRIFEAEHSSNDTWHFYPFAMVWAMFPWSAFVVISLLGLYKHIRKAGEPVYLFLASWIAAVFLIFQPCHSKLVSYIFPMFPALAILSADLIYRGAAQNQRPRLVFSAFLLTVLALVVSCVGLAVGSVLFSRYITTYLPNKLPVYILLALLFILVILCSVFIACRRLLKTACVLMLFIPVLFSIVPQVSKYIDPYLSSRDICRYLQDNYKLDNTILVSKFFTRGVRYYTEKKVAVIDIPGNGFFSPHPIAFLNSDSKVLDLLRRQPVTYCVLKKTALQDIQRFSNEFDYKVLKVIGNEYLVRIKPRTLTIAGRGVE